MLLFDAHLDLAYNALRGRDVLRPAREQSPDEEGIPSVGLPDLRIGGVGLICATIFCAPASPKEPGYRSPDEAHEMAMKQMQWYRRQAQDGQIDIVDRRERLSRRSPGAVILLEGADPIRSVRDVAVFFGVGVRVVGLAWRQTRYAGGTGAPGPLTPEGVRLVRELDNVGIIHDASHLAEESFWQLLELSGGRVIASHSNCRSIVPTDRQLSDEMIRAVAKRDGVIGINFYDKFLLPPQEQGKRRATLGDVTAHLRHMCDVIGDDRHVGIGTDMDGGLGREQVPVEIESSADLGRLGDALSSAGFHDAAVAGILGGNWLRFFSEALPA